MDLFRVYPFLISRNFDKDYRLVYAPTSCLSSENSGKLFDATSDATEGGDHNLRFTTLDLSSSSLPCGVVYRVIHATGFDIGEDSPKKLTDNVGRTIYHVEGILTYRTDNHLVDLIDKERFSQLVHIPMMHRYRIFWRQTTSGDDVPTESAISLSSLILEQGLKPLEPEVPDQVTTSGKKEATKLGGGSRLIKRLLEFAFAVGFVAVVISFIYSRKATQVNVSTKSILSAQDNNTSFDEKLVKLVDLSRKYSVGVSQSDNINCVALHLIMTNIHDGHQLKVVLQEVPTDLSKKSIGSDIRRLQRSLSSCQEKMKSLPFAINERIKFLKS